MSPCRKSDEYIDNLIQRLHIIFKDGKKIQIADNYIDNTIYTICDKRFNKFNKGMFYVSYIDKNGKLEYKFLNNIILDNVIMIFDAEKAMKKRLIKAIDSDIGTLSVLPNNILFEISTLLA